MKLTRHDKPIGHAKAWPVMVEPEPDEDLRRWAEHYRLDIRSVRKFVRRHPELSDWPPHDICRQVWHNRDRSYRAARQNIAGKRFQPIEYRREDIDYVPVTQREWESRYGLGKGTVSQFLRRNPECRAWPMDRVCKQIIANRDQSSVAKRQQTGRQGFAGIDYSGS